MKKVFCLVAIIVFILLSSCEPVEKTVLSLPPVDSSARTETEVRQLSNPRNLRISFGYVENATEYQVSAKEARNEEGENLGLQEIMPVTVSSADYYNEKFRTTLSGFVPGGSYDITVKAKNNANSDWVTVSREKYDVANAAPSASEAPSYRIEPSSSKTSLTVSVNTTVGYKYLVSLSSDETRSIEKSDIRVGTGGEVDFSFRTDSEASYSLSVSYAYITAPDESLSDNTPDESASVGSSVDMALFNSDIVIDFVEESGKFTVSGLPAGVTSFTISDYARKISSKSQRVDSQNNSYTVDSSDFIQGLEHGYFYVYAVNDKAETITSIDSAWCFRKPIYNTEDVSKGTKWQTFTLDWDVSPSIGATYSMNVKKSADDVSTISEDPSRSKTYTINNDGISISGLSSKTKYEAEITIITSDNESCTFKIPFETKSFTGRYRWMNPSSGSGPADFIVDVEDARDDSAYQYYVYVDSADSDNTENKENYYRVLPLIDSKETVTDRINFKSPGKYAKENTSYEWNYKKWATMSASINYWYPCAMKKANGSYIVNSDMPNLNYRDYVLTNVTTNATAVFVSTDATTKTSWTFRENNGQPEVIFRNEGEGLAALGMFKNPSPPAGFDQWSFLLTSDGGAI